MNEKRFSSMGKWTSEYDKDGKCTSVTYDKEFLGLLEIKTIDATDSEKHWRKIIHPDDFQMIYKVYENLFSKHSKDMDYDMECRPLVGKEYHWFHEFVYCTRRQAVWSWYAGGGIGCSAFYENGELRIYQACFEERQEPFLDSEKILYKTACALSDCSITEGIFLPTPEYTRELKKEKINMYGADIMYLQSVLVNLYGLNIDIDGYFGKQTLAAVKLVQKKLGFAETGIVDKHFWESVVIQHQ